MASASNGSSAYALNGVFCKELRYASAASSGVTEDDDENDRSVESTSLSLATSENWDSDVFEVTLLPRRIRVPAPESVKSSRCKSSVEIIATDDVRGRSSRRSLISLTFSLVP